MRCVRPRVGRACSGRTLARGSGQRPPAAAAPAHGRRATLSAPTRFAVPVQPRVPALRFSLQHVACNLQHSGACQRGVRASRFLALCSLGPRRRLRVRCRRCEGRRGAGRACAALRRGRVRVLFRAKASMGVRGRVGTSTGRRGALGVDKVSARAPRRLRTLPPSAGFRWQPTVGPGAHCQCEAKRTVQAAASQRR